MSGAGRIGIVGAAGAVGRSAARALAAVGLRERLRLGGRRPAALAADGPGGRVETAPVDLDQPASLAAFCRGCRVVVGCTPAYLTGDRVAAAALAAGADYVDAGGDDELRERLARHDPAAGGRTALLAAGAMPGVSGLLPRWLARRELDVPVALTGYAWTLDRITPGSAADFLRSLGGAYGEAQAAWRAGMRVSHDLQPLHEVALPFFDGRVTAYPFLTTEMERLARTLRLREARWYNVFDAPGQVLPALGRLQEALALGTELDRAADELSRVAELDLFGRARQQQLVVQLDGLAGGLPVSRTAVLRAAGTYELTGAMTALAVDALLGRAAPAGVHFAADVLDPGLVESLRDAPGVVGLHVLDGSLDALAEVEQGVI